MVHAKNAANAAPEPPGGVNETFRPALNCALLRRPPGSNRNATRATGGIVRPGRTQPPANGCDPSPGSNHDPSGTESQLHP